MIARHKSVRVEPRVWVGRQARHKLGSGRARRQHGGAALDQVPPRQGSTLLPSRLYSRTMWTMGRPAEREPSAMRAIASAAADEPGTSSGWPSSTSRWTSIVMSALLSNSGVVYGAMMVI
jgi:hypothetical protein